MAGLMTIYISGSMAGSSRYNSDAFYLAAAQLAAAGYNVLNPAGVGPDYEVGAPPHHREWYLRRALKHLVDADGIALLPGWEASPCASLEIEIASNLAMPCALVSQWLD